MRKQNHKGFNFSALSNNVVLLKESVGDSFYAASLVLIY
ncbi:hypothetical protein AALB_2294 [Agarivorans albus MKT 106]|uniref:Uncharacterized protein n=1 Tax=Agarivorans albus MKT 106 TaxID=1331007 RepID=R9PLG3_AGAAL|nr:hypothetical protein AALB_2294 [Agarivorans albus MKT 106]